MIWLDTILQGILLGGLYALFATGLSLIFGIMRLVNLAHGDLIILAAFVILVITEILDLSPFLALLLAAPCLAFFGYCLQRFLLNRTLGNDILVPLLVTVGLSIMLQNGLLMSFTADSQRLQAGNLETASINVSNGISIGVIPLLTLISSVLVILGLNWIFYHTSLGRALRAVSDDPITAQLMGIENKHLFALATAMAVGVAAIAGLFLGIRANFDPTIGPARLLYAFEAVIIGGLGSLWGTLLGGIVIGVSQTVGAKVNPEWQILAGHIAFLVVVVFKPRGFFPRAVD